MNRKSKVIVSIVGITIVLLALLGLTYAYYLTRIEGNTNTNSIIITTADLKLTYFDGVTEILTSSSPIIPGEFKSSKDFSVTNNGNQTVENYGVILEEFSIIYASNTSEHSAGERIYLEYPEDMKLTITCTSSIENKDCFGLNGTLPTTNDILLTNTIEVNETQTYVLTLEYVDSGLDQSADMNKSISGKINIIDTKDTIDIAGTVTNYSDGDFIQINSTPRTAAIDKNGNYKVVGLEPDTHTVSIISDTIKEVDKIKIKKGNNENVSNDNPNLTEITITDDSRIVKMDINASTTAANISSSISSINPYAKGTLAYEIINNAMIAKENNSTLNAVYSPEPLTNIGTLNGENEKTLSVAKDEYGDSYYYRGNVSDDGNVIFNGMWWKVIRIEGDGSIKMIYSMPITQHICDGVLCGAGPDWGRELFFDAIGGYKITQINGLNVGLYNYVNNIDNSAYNVLNKWLNDNFTEQKQAYLKNDEWCLGSKDKDLMISEENSVIYYSSAKRIENGNYSFICQEDENFFYNKIAGLTIDEFIYAGNPICNTAEIDSNYLLNSYEITTSFGWQLLTRENNTYAYFDSSFDPIAFDGTFTVMISDYGNGEITYQVGSLSVVNSVVLNQKFRPVITLKPGVEVEKSLELHEYSGAHGSNYNPYVIKGETNPFITCYE